MLSDRDIKQDYDLLQLKKNHKASKGPECARGRTAGIPAHITGRPAPAQGLPLTASVFLYDTGHGS